MAVEVFIKSQLGPIPATCPCCGKPDDFTIAIRPRLTAYNDDHLNYLTSCAECYKMDYEYYAERWEEYWSGCL